MANYYEGIPGQPNRGLCSKEDMLDQNYFADFSVEELKEIFDQYRFFCNNGYTPKGHKLDEIRMKICEQIPHGVVVMEMQLLNAIAVKMFMEDEENG